MRCYKDFSLILGCYCCCFSRLVRLDLFFVYIFPTGFHSVIIRRVETVTLRTSLPKQRKNWMNLNWQEQQHLSSWASTDWVVLETVIFVIAKLSIYEADCTRQSNHPSSQLPHTRSPKAVLYYIKGEFIYSRMQRVFVSPYTKIT